MLEDKRTVETIKFSAFINQVKDVQRKIFIASKPDRFENDAEHSFDISCMAIYIIRQYELHQLDLLKVVQMCLFHDLVEVFAGDECSISSSPEALLKLKEKEKEAFEDMKILFPEADWMHELIEEFEKQESAEARFVKALDRTVPALIELFSSFKSIKYKGLDWDAGEKRLNKAYSISPELKPFLDEIIPYLRYKYEQSIK